jgi:hypothetical protein
MAWQHIGSRSITATGTVRLRVESLTGDVEARANAGMNGASVPIQATGQVIITGLEAHARVVVKVRFAGCGRGAPCRTDSS